MLQLYNQGEYASVVTHGNPLHTDSAELGCDGGLRRCFGTHCTLYLGRTNKLQRKHFTRHITRVDKKKNNNNKQEEIELSRVLLVVLFQAGVGTFTTSFVSEPKEATQESNILLKSHLVLCWFIHYD
ncbi:hypothetical protein ILYODFUR_029235 [Ilyodon furcidens]|uniref:Uncharacterized protein n=1 Tax=Ilyodon furcidens TaxID=33524 RepID=A0ABV0UK05_9TELE